MTLNKENVKNQESQFVRFSCSTKKVFMGNFVENENLLKKEPSKEYVLEENLYNDSIKYIKKLMDENIGLKNHAIPFTDLTSILEQKLINNKNITDILRNDNFNLEMERLTKLGNLDKGVQYKTIYRAYKISEDEIFDLECKNIKLKKSLMTEEEMIEHYKELYENNEKIIDKLKKENMELKSKTIPY